MSRTPYPQQREVIYIMDTPPPPSNGWGVAGFVMGILGVFTFGLLSPLALLISLFALRKKPRGFATLGLAFGLLGTAFITTVAVAPVIAHRHRMAEVQRLVREEQTRSTMSQVVAEIERSRADQGQPLDGYQGNAITIQYKDGWDRELRYDEGIEGYAVRSAGGDGRFDTPDDVVHRGVSDQRTGARQVQAEEDGEAASPVRVRH